MSIANTIREDVVLALGSEYDIVRELGRGGASVVYLARDRVLGREVAIKVIRDTHVGDAEAIARFEREARTLASLQHPNIVMLYGAKPLPGGSLALVMQHGEWSTLKAVIREQGPLPIDAVQQVLHDLATALLYLHRHNVVHRDIKPENIFIEAETGRALLSDFGIAKSGDARTSVTLAGVVIGTPAYMSPEQIDGGALTGRSDLYSLGMVGFEMLSGVKPWDGESLFGVIYKQKTERLPSLLEVRPDIPEHLRLLIEKATEKAPEDRWTSAQELLLQISGPEAPPVPAVWAEPLKAVPAPLTVSPSEYPTLEIEQALADEAFAARERGRRRRQRLMAAAVVALMFSGGAGALAFSGRNVPPAATVDRSGPSATGDADRDVTSYASVANVVTDTPQVMLDTPILDTEPDSEEPETTTRPPPRAETRRPPVSRPAPDPEEEEDGDEEAQPQVPARPVSLMPELAVTRSGGARPSAQPSRMLESRPVEDVTPPRLRNREQVGQLLAEWYPSDLRTRAIGGTAIVTVLVSADGSVANSRVVTSSGNTRLDQAALSVADRMQFIHPAGTRRPQAMWVAVPLTFTP